MAETTKIAKVLAPLRASEWWESKFAPLFGTVYATCLILHIPFFNLATYFGFLLIALFPGACFVSIINDWTDLEEDQRAGKKNRLIGKSNSFIFGLISLCLVLGVIVSFFLSKVSIGLYLCAWIAFTLYSVPPFRLKGRGLLGVLADTLGANVFPQLFAAALLFDWFEKQIDLVWLGLIGIWTFLLGIRGIISHQLTDRKNDQTAGVNTFVQNYDVSSIRRFFNLVVFPLEIIVLLLLLYYSGNWLGIVFIGVYGIWLKLFQMVWETKFEVVTHTKKMRLLMNDYYFIFYPISFLLAGLAIFPFTWIFIIFHCVLFSFSLAKFLFESYKLLIDAWLNLREFLFGY